MNKIAKLTYLAVVTSLISQTAIAEEKNLSDRVQGCIEITQDTARLACFDQLLSKPSAKKVEAQVAEITAKQVDSFSKEHVKKTAEEKAKEIDSIILTISQLSKSPYDQWKITFENGQKWQQKDNYKLRLKIGQRVILTKGSLSSVFLQKENSTKRIKVKRLK